MPVLQGVKRNKCFKDISAEMETSYDTIASIASGETKSAMIEYTHTLTPGTVAVANIEDTSSDLSGSLWGVSMCTYIAPNIDVGTTKAAVTVYIKNDTGVTLSNVRVRVTLLTPNIEVMQ